MSRSWIWANCGYPSKNAFVKHAPKRLILFFFSLFKATSVQDIINLDILQILSIYYLGHVPLDSLFRELASGKRLRRGTKRRFKDQLTTSLTQFNLVSETRETVATNRSSWRRTIRGVIFMSNLQYKEYL